MGVIRLRSSEQFARGDKIQAIKSLRAITNMGLREAKDAVEGMPCNIEIPEYMDTLAIAQELRDNYFDAEAIIPGDMGTNATLAAGTNSPAVERAFQDLLIALIKEKQYDEVIRFIEFRKKGNNGRTLEVM